MITKLYLSNFRRISKSELELAPITILTGANNSGKSSILYSLLTLRNVVSNANQPLDSLFNFVFLNLGGFKEVVSLKDEDRTIRIRIENTHEQAVLQYGLEFGKEQSGFDLNVAKPYDISLRLPVTFPYASSASTGVELKQEFGSAKISWNGLTSTISIEEFEGSEEEKKSHFNKLQSLLNSAWEQVREVEFIPLRRGFTKPNYSAVPLQEQLLSEEEIATFLANDRDLEGRTSYYLEKVVNKYLNVRPILGAASFHVQTTDRTTGFVCDLVNEGFGTNQLVYLLVKSLRKGKHTICIEEPEIHLHPEAISGLVDVLIEISRDSKKNFIISTHSEHLVVSLLSRVAQKKIEPTDIKLYYLEKKKQTTTVEPQDVNEKGQVSGGLKSFFEAELRETREFLNIPKEE